MKTWFNFGGLLSDGAFLDCLTTPLKRVKYLKYASTESDPNNVLFLLCVAQYRGDKLPSLEKAYAIHTAFLAKGSAFEVNINSSKVKKVALGLRKSRSRFKTPKEIFDLFDDIGKDVATQVGGDSFARYLETDRQFNKKPLKYLDNLGSRVGKTSNDLFVPFRQQAGNMRRALLDLKDVGFDLKAMGVWEVFF